MRKMLTLLLIVLTMVSSVSVHGLEDGVRKRRELTIGDSTNLQIKASVTLSDVRRSTTYQGDITVDVWGILPDAELLLRETVAKSEFTIEGDIVGRLNTAPRTIQLGKDKIAVSLQLQSVVIDGKEIEELAGQLTASGVFEPVPGTIIRESTDITGTIDEGRIGPKPLSDDRSI